MTKEQKSKLASDMLWHYLLAAEALSDDMSAFEKYNLLRDLGVHNGLCYLYSAVSSSLFRSLPFKPPPSKIRDGYWWRIPGAQPLYRAN